MEWKAQRAKVRGPSGATASMVEEAVWEAAEPGHAEFEVWGGCKVFGNLVETKFADTSV